MAATIKEYNLLELTQRSLLEVYGRFGGTSIFRTYEQAEQTNAILFNACYVCVCMCVSVCVCMYVCMDE
jgi:hypothetical protein